MSEAGYVDAAVAEPADGRIPWTRFETLVDAKVTAAAPALTREREQHARQARFAKTCHGQGSAMASFLIRADVATITAIDTVITAVAAAPKTALPDLSTDERRLRAIMLLLHQRVSPDSPARSATPDHVDQAAADDTPPWEKTSTDTVAGGPVEPDEPADPAVAQAGTGARRHRPRRPAAHRPAVRAHLHRAHRRSRHRGRARPSETGDQEPIARVEGHGPVTHTWVREVLGATCRFTIPPSSTSPDRHPSMPTRTPTATRHAVHLITPADIFPHAASLARHHQIDHTVPYQPNGPPGQSAISNHGPMTTSHHRTKTHTGWHVRQPFTGIYLWQDPHAGHHLVDHTGTRRLRPPPTTPITIELHHNPTELVLAH